MTAKMPALAALVFMAVKVSALIVFCWNAYTIRLHAIEEYGRVIHEFDPWFNYRATEVRAHHLHGCRQDVPFAPSRHQLPWYLVLLPRFPFACCRRLDKLSTPPDHHPPQRCDWRNDPLDGVIFEPFAASLALTIV
jgi:hypothetical protein